MTIIFPFLFKQLPGKTYKAMALWPFILVKEKRYLEDQIIMNHEKIHLVQQKELLIFPFYIIYFCEYIFYRIYNNHHHAYLKISFEKEAFTHENDLSYLKNRKTWANFR